MRVEAQEMIKDHPYYPEAGDVLSVPDTVGQYWVDNGWAKNVETGEIGARQGGAVSLDIDNSKLGLTSPEV